MKPNGEEACSGPLPFPQTEDFSRLLPKGDKEKLLCWFYADYDGCSDGKGMCKTVPIGLDRFSET